MYERHLYGIFQNDTVVAFVMKEEESVYEAVHRTEKKRKCKYSEYDIYEVYEYHPEIEKRKEKLMHSYRAG